ncbi:MAG: PspC domain-containing protein [Gaiellaceae bacterium]
MSDTIDTSTLDQAPPRRLTRATDGRWLGGVAAGLARYFDVSPLVYRIAFAALAFVGGTGILLYVAAWLVMPAEDRDDSIAVETLRENRDRPWLLLGVGLLGFFALLALSEGGFWPGADNIWLAALLGGGALLWWHLGRPDPPVSTAAPPVPTDGAEPAAVAPASPQPRRPSLAAPVVGVLLAAAGVLGLLAALDAYHADVELALAGAIAVVGIAVAAGAFTGFRVAGLVGLGLVLLAVFGAVVSSPVSVSAGVGEKVERPLDAAALERTYEYGIGDFELDLTRVELPEGETRVDVSLGIGELVVAVPEDATVVVDAHAAAGEVDVAGSRDDGIGADKELTLSGPDDDSPVLVLAANVGFGRIAVVRE